MFKIILMGCQYEQPWLNVNLDLWNLLGPSGSGEEDFLRFLPYMGVVAILVM